MKPYFTKLNFQVMKKIKLIMLTAIALCSLEVAFSQTGTLCSGNKGPNLLGARGTFSAPYILPNNNADACLHNGANTYSPTGNVGGMLEGCSNPSGNLFPCSDYNYTDKYYGMMPEFTYSILKVIGDENGNNCIHSPMWTGKDHTGDGGYFLAVNGAADITQTPIFYQMKNIPVCIGSTYEFSAYVLNLFNKGETNSTDPSITFIVNDTDTIGTSGVVPKGAGWVKVGGSFVAKTNFVNLKVVNSTVVAGGNDLGLDDISFQVCESRIVPPVSEAACEGEDVTINFNVFDPTVPSIPGGSYKYYKIEVSRDGKISWNTRSSGFVTYDATGNGTVSYTLKNVSTDFGSTNANGNVYRLSVATSIPGLSNPECIYFNDYTLLVASCGPTPVELSAFNGKYDNGTATLNWTTSQEINNNHFDLFRSFDGKDFSKIATVQGSGTSYTAKNYKYEDKVPAGGNEVYYKLKQVDQDGKFTFSKVIKLSTTNAFGSMRVYPNPVHNNFTASFTAPQGGKANLVITSTMGQVVYKKSVDVNNGNNSVQVDVPQLQPGMYYIQISNDQINYKSKLQKN